MLIAAALFGAGILEGWRYRAQVVGASSMLVGIGCLTIWARTSSIDGEKILVLLAYLAAHQAGYLAGAYLSIGIRHDRSYRLPQPDDPAGIEINRDPDPDRQDH